MTASASASEKDDLVGRVIAGKFALESVIGRGAMGAVYRAKQTALDMPIAMKVLHPELTRDPQFSGRFLREAQAASRIDHPNSMRVLDFGEEPDGLLYIAMELLEGRDLFAFLKAEWPLTVRRTAEVVMQVLAALAVAHDMGVVHRDLKPENIMVLDRVDDEGIRKDLVKVCDFGIAKMSEGRGTVDGAPRLTTVGLIVGTPEYMSPEQGRGEELDPRSDIYAVGVILYQMLAGRVPFDADTALGVVLRHVTEDPEPPSRRVAHVDPRLEAVCLRALAKKPEGRFAGAREMRAELRRIVDSEVDLDAPASVASRSALRAAGAVAAFEPKGGDTQVAKGAAAMGEAPTAVALQAPVSIQPSSAPRAIRRLTSDSLLPPPTQRATGYLIAVPIVVAALGIVVFFAANAMRAPKPPPVVASASASSVPFVPPSDLGGVPAAPPSGSSAVPSASVPSAPPSASALESATPKPKGTSGKAAPATASHATKGTTPAATDAGLSPLPSFPIPSGTSTTSASAPAATTAAASATAALPTAEPKASPEPKAGDKPSEPKPPALDAP